MPEGSEKGGNVRPDYCFRQGDILFVAGGASGLDKFTDWVDNA